MTTSKQTDFADKTMISVHVDTKKAGRFNKSYHRPAFFRALIALIVFS